MDRSANMRAIRSVDMLPELAVRKLLYGMGYRYRLHAKELPGKPDIVFRARRKVIFVHGCFWHSHNCTLAHIPRSNRDYWLPKLRRNRDRDQKNLELLRDQGWKCLVIWECETRDEPSLRIRLDQFVSH